jgi:hypothetical protein
MGFLNKIFSSLKKASRKRVELNTDSKTLQILLNSGDEQYFTLEFDRMNKTNLSDSSIQEAYSIVGENSSLGTLYIEVIRLRVQHKWQVSPGSAFDRIIQDSFRSHELRFKDSFDDRFCKLTKYELDYENEIGTIWLSLNQYEVFILDAKGQLFNDLLKIYLVKNSAMQIHNLTIANISIQNSVVASNMLESFFGNTN